MLALQLRGGGFGTASSWHAQLPAFGSSSNQFFSCPAARLAVCTEARRSSAEDDSFDRFAAAPARLAGAVVDCVELLECTSAAFGIDVISQRTSTMTQRFIQSLLDGSV